MTSSIYVIKRCSQHHLHWNTRIKDKILESLFPVYKQELEKCIDHLMELDAIPTFGSFDSSVFESSVWKQIVFANASEILSSQLKIARNRRYKSYKKNLCKGEGIWEIFKVCLKKVFRTESQTNSQIQIFQKTRNKECQYSSGF